MVQGNFVHGDYFLDCDLVSESALRAIFGVWINVCVGVIAFSLRFVFRSRLRKHLLTNDAGNRQAHLWHISPATTPSEVFQLRFILTRACIYGDLFYVFASLICVIVAIVSAASTTIANHAIVTNIVQRHTVIQGRLVTHEHVSLSGAAVNVTSRVQALNQANAPLEQVFDFIPDDSFEWVFLEHEWNNTWHGECTYSKHPAVDLVVYPSNSTNYQNEVPLLGNWLPRWATVDPTQQGTHYSGFFNNAHINGSGNWQDLVVTYAFGRAAGPNVTSPQAINISFANYLAHGIARDSNTTFLQTAFKSDVHVVECTLYNSVPGGIEDQAYPYTRNYADAASNVASVYERYIVDTSIAQQPVIQPTAEQMLRNWQSYLSVKDGQYPHPVQRDLTVSKPVVQIRLSVLVTTIGAFVVALMASIVSRWIEPLDQHGKRLILPSSQLDWIVQAAREHFREADLATTRSPSAYAMQREDLMLAISNAPDANMVTCIASATEKGYTSDGQAYIDQQSQSFDDEQVMRKNVTNGDAC